MTSAREPLPEKGLTSTSLVSSFGMPNMPNTGDRRSETAFDSPLASKSSVRRKMAARKGNNLTARGIAPPAPSVNAS